MFFEGMKTGLNLGTACSCETLVCTCESVQSYDPEDQHIKFSAEFLLFSDTQDVWVGALSQRKDSAAWKDARAHT